MAKTNESRFRVRYAETDQMGFSYYANYLVWMEVGRADFCRVCGFSYAELERETQTYLAVAEANCRYISPARYDDEVLVQTSLERANRRLLRFVYSFRHASTGELLAEGYTVHVPLTREGKPKSIPDFYLKKLLGP
jgi:acyl-CoA thioester hydrolase